MLQITPTSKPSDLNYQIFVSKIQRNKFYLASTIVLPASRVLPTPFIIETDQLGVTDTDDFSGSIIDINRWSITYPITMNVYQNGRLVVEVGKSPIYNQFRAFYNYLNLNKDGSIAIDCALTDFISTNNVPKNVGIVLDILHQDGTTDIVKSYVQSKNDSYYFVSLLNGNEVNSLLIQSSGNITSISNSGEGIVKIYSSNVSELRLGDSITITGTSFYNGIFSVINITSTYFEIRHSWEGTDIGSWAKEIRFIAFNVTRIDNTISVTGNIRDLPFNTISRININNTDSLRYSLCIADGDETANNGSFSEYKVAWDTFITREHSTIEITIDGTIVNKFIPTQQKNLVLLQIPISSDQGGYASTIRATQISNGIAEIEVACTYYGSLMAGIAEDWYKRITNPVYNIRLALRSLWSSLQLSPLLPKYSEIPVESNERRTYLAKLIAMSAVNPLSKKAIINLTTGYSANTPVLSRNTLQSLCANPLYNELKGGNYLAETGDILNTWNTDKAKHSLWLFSLFAERSQDISIIEESDSFVSVIDDGIVTRHYLPTNVYEECFPDMSISLADTIDVPLTLCSTQMPFDNSIEYALYQSAPIDSIDYYEQFPIQIAHTQAWGRPKDYGRIEYTPRLITAPIAGYFSYYPYEGNDIFKKILTKSFFKQDNGVFSYTPGLASYTGNFIVDSITSLGFLPDFIKEDLDVFSVDQLSKDTNAFALENEGSWHQYDGRQFQKAIQPQDPNTFIINSNSFSLLNLMRLPKYNGAIIRDASTNTDMMYAESYKAWLPIDLVMGITDAFIDRGSEIEITDYFTENILLNKWRIFGNTSDFEYTSGNNFRIRKTGVTPIANLRLQNINTMSSGDFTVDFTLRPDLFTTTLPSTNNIACYLNIILDTHYYFLGFQAPSSIFSGNHNPLSWKTTSIGSASRVILRISRLKYSYSLQMNIDNKGWVILDSFIDIPVTKTPVAIVELLFRDISTANTIAVIESLEAYSYSSPSAWGHLKKWSEGGFTYYVKNKNNTLFDIFDPIDLFSEGYLGKATSGRLDSGTPVIPLVTTTAEIYCAQYSKNYRSVISALTSGQEGNLISISLIGDSLSGVFIIRDEYHFTIHYENKITTASEIDFAIDSLIGGDKLIYIEKYGTDLILDSSYDNFQNKYLTGGAEIMVSGGLDSIEDPHCISDRPIVSNIIQTRLEHTLLFPWHVLGMMYLNGEEVNDGLNDATYKNSDILSEGESKISDSLDDSVHKISDGLDDSVKKIEDTFDEGIP